MRLNLQLAKISYNFRNGVKVVLSEVLQLVYEAAALCINTLRMPFELILLAILGPLVIGLSDSFDPFKQVLSALVGKICRRCLPLVAGRKYFRLTLRGRSRRR